MYMCAVDIMYVEIVWGELLYSDATPFSPLSSLPLSLHSPTCYI
jgi:hypothetical protein